TTLKRKDPSFSPSSLFGRLLSLLFSSPLLFAQGPTGEIDGIVIDSGGSAVLGASVTVTDPATGTTRSTLSNSSGFYSFPALSPSTYTVTLDATGFHNDIRPRL